MRKSLLACFLLFGMHLAGLAAPSRGDDALLFAPSAPVVPEFSAPQRLPAPPDYDAGDPAVQTPIEDDFRARFTALENDWKKLKAAEGQKKDEAAQKPTFRMRGQIQIDALWFGQDAESRAAVGDVQDALNFRRARLIAQGEAFEVFNYSIGFDFALGTASNGRPQFHDVFIGQKDLPVVGNARIGHFFEPFSLERITSNRYNTFMERSLADAFAPARNLGAMIFNHAENERSTWALGTFRSNSDNFGDDAGDQEGQAVTGRFTWLPLYDEASSGRSYLHLGGGYSYRQAADGVVQYRSRPEAIRRSENENISTPFFVDTGTLAANSNQLLGAEALWTHGPFSVQGEYMYVPIDRVGGSDVEFHGAYLYASYFLTGEHRPYNKVLGITDRIEPFENFFRVRTADGPICTGRGAWEIAARVSHIDLTDQGVNGGRLTDFTAGINWYLTPYHRVKWEYIHAQLDCAPSGRTETDIFGMRFDMDF